MRRPTLLAASALALCYAAPAAWAQGCPTDATGSVRILSNDFIALRAVIDAASECASETLEISSNATTEHATLQVPSLMGTPAEYSVVMVANSSVLPLVNQSLVRPLDDLVAEYGQQLDPSQLIKLNGQTVAIAFMANAQHLIYRPDILEQAGVEPPTSYEEVLEAAEAIKSAGLMDTPFAANVKPGWDLGEEFVNMYLGCGGEFFADGTANFDIDPTKGAQALEMLKSLAAYMPADFQTFDSNTVSALYHEGRVGLIQMWGSRAGSYLGPNSIPEVAENTVFAAAPTVGGGSIPATTIWWDGFSIAQNISDEDAEASFRVMMHAIDTPTATNNPDAAAWLIPGFEPGPASAGVIASAEAGAKPYPMVPQMDILHEVLGAELADFMAGRETAEQALSDAQGAYEAEARTQGYLE